MNLPEAFIDRMKDLLGDELAAYLKSLDEDRYYGLRVNTLKVSKDFYDSLEPVPWCPGGFYYQADARPAKSPFYHGGLYYIQEPSAMAPAALIGLRPGDKVLDLCAAPGGKSTQIASRLQGKGLLVSNDISASRCKALVKNIENMGITNAVVTNEEPACLTRAFPAFFDAILIDAPCSGEGMFRKDPAAVKSWSEKNTARFQSLQKALLSQAAVMLKAGGEIMYSTCTFAPEENEMVIQKFLDEHTDFEPLPIDHSAYGFDRGHPEWAAGDKRLYNCARLWPHKLKGEGHFLARLQKKESDEEAKEETCLVKALQKKALPMHSHDLSYFHTFCRENLKGFDAASTLLRNKDSLYLVPEPLCEGSSARERLNGIRVARSGWYLGELKTKRFEPSQAFAMGLMKKDTKTSIDFQIEDSAVIRYLKGESLCVDVPEGWVLVCVEGFPLGWGKVQQGRLKNKYLPSWKME